LRGKVVKNLGNALETPEPEEKPGALVERNFLPKGREHDMP